MIEQKDKLVATRATRIVIALNPPSTCIGAVVARCPDRVDRRRSGRRAEHDRAHRVLVRSPKARIAPRSANSSAPMMRNCIVKVTRVQGPDGRGFYVTRGSTCGERVCGFS